MNVIFNIFFINVSLQWLCLIHQLCIGINALYALIREAAVQKGVYRTLGRAFRGGGRVPLGVPGKSHG